MLFFGIEHFFGKQAYMCVTSVILSQVTCHFVHTHRVAFFIISFNTRNEIYFLEAQKVIDFIKNEDRKSLPYEYIKENGHLIEQGYLPRLDYLKIFDELYF